MNAGDTVMLKSGGPIMTADKVSTRDGVPTAWCVWFDGKKKEQASFPVTSLKAMPVGDALG
jgi:uncharacterized protein YodC (DUF2158 family)